MKQKFLLPIIALFILLNALLFTANTLLVKWNIDKNLLMVANLLLFVLAIVTIFLQHKALQNKNPNVFIRSVMGSMLIKMFACGIAVAAYALLSSSGVNAAGILAAMFFYLVYLAVETKIVMKMNKKNG